MHQNFNSNCLYQYVLYKNIIINIVHFILCEFQMYKTKVYEY